MFYTECFFLFIFIFYPPFVVFVEVRNGILFYGADCTVTFFFGRIIFVLLSTF